MHSDLIRSDFFGNTGLVCVQSLGETDGGGRRKNGKTVGEERNGRITFFIPCFSSSVSPGVFALFSNFVKAFEIYLQLKARNEALKHPPTNQEVIANKATYLMLYLNEISLKQAEATLTALKV